MVASYTVENMEQCVACECYDSTSDIQDGKVCDENKFLERRLRKQGSQNRLLQRGRSNRKLYKGQSNRSISSMSSSERPSDGCGEPEFSDDGECRSSFRVDGDTKSGGLNFDMKEMNISESNKYKPVQECTRATRGRNRTRYSLNNTESGVVDAKGTLYDSKENLQGTHTEEAKEYRGIISVSNEKPDSDMFLPINRPEARTEQGYNCVDDTKSHDDQKHNLSMLSTDNMSLSQVDDLSQQMDPARVPQRSTGGLSLRKGLIRFQQTFQRSNSVRSLDVSSHYQNFDDQTRFASDDKHVHNDASERRSSPVSRIEYVHETEENRIDRDSEDLGTCSVSNRHANNAASPFISILQLTLEGQTSKIKSTPVYFHDWAIIPTKIPVKSLASKTGKHLRSSATESR